MAVSKIRGRIEKMRPLRVQTGKSGPCPRYRQMAQLRYRWPQVAIPRPGSDTCPGSPYSAQSGGFLNTQCGEVEQQNPVIVNARR